MFRSLVLTILGATMLFSVAADAQDKSILLDMSINYGVAFRDASWVPIDIFVRNTERDVKGYVEIRTYNFNGDLQSPTYRLPAESPRNSQKRFRLYCKLAGVDRIEAQLYHGNRKVLPVPTWLQVTAIDREDYLGLILDDAHHDYGFLSDPAVIGRAESRFHREGLKSKQLGYLADHLPCYTAFDIIIMGNIDPERIGAEHRELIRQYVRLGGTLVVSLGTNADRYKGSWVESLMGVSIGANTFQSEPALALAALGLAPDADGITPNREGMVTTLTPTSENVQSLGKSYRLGSIRTLGSGRVATFTVDALSGLMQHQDDYLAIWNRLLLQSIVDRPMNMGAVIQSASQNLPRIAGVRLFPVSSVIIYLLLYFFIAIVGNWLFWNWMKRREMAWVCLVFFSLAFTSYAMIFGTQGRARTTQLEQLEILEFAGNNDTALLHGVTGLLAKGSGRFNATLVHPNTLLSDAARSMAIGVNQPRGLFGAQSQNAFHFIQGEAGRIEGLTVGASEMRFIQTEAPITLDGALEVDLTASNDGLRGTITNNTGMELVNPTLLYEGVSVPLKYNDGVYLVELDQDSSRDRGAGLTRLTTGAAETVPEDADDLTRQGFNSFLAQLPQLALHSEDRSIPPCLIAWVNAPPLGSVDMGHRAKLHLGATLVVAWLNIRDERAFGTEPIDLPVRIVDSNYGQAAYANQFAGNNLGMNRRGMPVSNSYAPVRILHSAFAQDGSDWQQMSLPVYPYDRLAFAITLPEWVRGRPGYRVEIIATSDPNIYDDQHGQNSCTIVDAQYNKRGFQLTLLSNDAQKETALSVTGSETYSLELGDVGTLSATTCRLGNWADLLLH
ncbi:MAG: hypothetical protein L3K26_06370, partial [Candidatus Hydrogenedentes bacterium]|nr:hypothetical protein [Candidatus Hydrogenedentota bacterium]